MNIKYRVMTSNDYNEVINLWKKAPEISFSDSDEEPRIVKYLKDNPNSSFVACDNNKIIGTILAGDDSRRGFINHLYVLPEYRHNGIGNELLRLSEQTLSTTNATKSYVFVKRDNNEGITFWKKKNYYLCDDFVVLRKSLSSDRFSVYEELDEDSIKLYLDSVGNMVDNLSEIKEFGDGNMNHIFKISNNNESFILKQAMPHGKIDISVFEPTDRSFYEHEYVSYFRNYIPEYIVECKGYDSVMFASIYEDLSNMKVLRSYTFDGVVNPNVGKDIGKFLALQYYYSSYFFLGAEKKKSMENTFSNYRMRQLTEEYILMNPFEESENNNIDSSISHLVDKIVGDTAVVSKAKYLANKFISCKECIIGGDFHPGNVFYSNERTVFFDFDFAMWGPISYDIGTMLGNLIISFRTSYVHNSNWKIYQKNIISIINNIYDTFSNSLLEKLSSLNTNVVNEMIRTFFYDSFGYAASTIAGRTYGYARFKEIVLLEGSKDRIKIISQLVDDVLYLSKECSDIQSLVDYLNSISI